MNNLLFGKTSIMPRKNKETQNEKAQKEKNKKDPEPESMKEKLKKKYNNEIVEDLEALKNVEI